MKGFILGLLVAALLIGFSEAGDITKRSYSRHFEWESTDCFRPYAPIIFELDQSNRWQAENYINDVDTYITCVNNEAQTDYAEAQKKLAAAIEEGRDNTISIVRSEVDLFVSGLN